MLMRVFSVVSGVAVGLAAAFPARAQDSIEAKVQLCATCHGDKGVPTDPKTIPPIWGQQQSYLTKQLRDFRSGERKSERQPGNHRKDAYEHDDLLPPRSVRQNVAGYPSPIRTHHR